MPLAYSPPAHKLLYINVPEQPPVHSLFESRTRLAILKSRLSKFPAMSITCRVSLLLLIAVLTTDSGHSASIRTYEPRLTDEVIIPPKKRPFCNAFTGCGRKRSSSPAMPVQELLRQRQFVDDDAFVPLVESDNAIEDLSRQILSEAKLWEAIQEASAEIARRKQKETY